MRDEKKEEVAKLEKELIPEYRGSSIGGTLAKAPKTKGKKKVKK